MVWAPEMLRDLSTNPNMLLVKRISVMTAPFLFDRDLVFLTIRLLVRREKWAQETI